MLTPASRKSEIEEEEGLLDSHSRLRAFPRQRKAHRLFSKYTKLTIVLKDIILLALAIPTLITLGQQAAHRVHSVAMQRNNNGGVPPLPGCNCGTSVAQAKKLGCRYDMLAAAWLPPHCIDEELTALFERSGDGPNGTWTYWSDLAHTKEIPAESIPALADDPAHGRFYATARWHITHCTFYWRKAIRSKALGITLEDRYNTEKHAIHCGKMIDADPTIGAVSGVALNSNRWDP